MKLKMLLLTMLLLCSCSTVKYTEITNISISPKIMEQMNTLYDPFLEKSFCLSSTEVHNILQGTLFTTPMPICKRSDIVVHSHPFIAEQSPNFIDLNAWSEYRKRYGNDMFGLLLGPNKLKVYELR